MAANIERVKDDRIVDRVELARFLNVDPDHLSVFVRAGMPKLHHGRYGLIACLAWSVSGISRRL